MSFGSLKSCVPAASFHSPAFALRAQRKQHLALRAQLHHCMRAHVGGPDIAFFIDSKTMAAGEQAFAEGSNEFSVLIELGDGLGSAAQNVEMALGIERDAGRRSHGHARGHRQGIGDRHVVKRRRLLRNQESGIRRPLRKPGRAAARRSEQNRGRSHASTPAFFITASHFVRICVATSNGSPCCSSGRNSSTESAPS